MASVISSNRRIAKNTLLLYFRMLLIAGVSLYTVRVVLNTLGVEDFGIFHVVAGLVALFSFLPGAMASATQRYFSHALGQQDGEKIQKIFTVNAVIYAVIALLALVVLETVGLWFVTQHLNVPAERSASAVQLYHFSVITFIVSIFTSPFMAIIIAHEDMKIYAYVAILEALLKLGTVFVLLVLPGEKLVIYGALLLGVALLNATTYITICRKRYSQCRFKREAWDPKLAREIVGFTGWTLFGQVTTVARGHAVTILLNQFFSPAVVAAKAVAMSVAGQANVLAQNFNVGLYPPIIKAYSSGNKKEMFLLVYNGSKFTFFLMWIVALPILMEMETLLGIWLKNPPEYAVLFARLAIIEALIQSVSQPLATAARAPGKMARYELTLGSVQIMIFATCWLLLWAGLPPYSVYIVAIVGNLIMFWIRLYLVRTLTGLAITKFLTVAITPIVTVVVVSVIASLYVKSFIGTGIVQAAGNLIFVCLISFICIYSFGLNREWRGKIIDIVKIRVLGFMKL